MAVIVSLSLTFATPVSASLQVVSGAGLIAIPDDNDFSGELLGYGLTQVFQGGADVKFLSDGMLSFFHYGSESSYKNGFVVGGEWRGSGSALESGDSLGLVGGDVIAEGLNGWQSDPPAALLKFSVAKDTYLSDYGIGFRVLDKNSNSGVAIDAIAGTAGFGIFVGDEYDAADPSLTYKSLFVGFDDNGASPEDNHDDMIMRISFSFAKKAAKADKKPSKDGVGAVPEAASIMTWGGLLATTVLIFRRRRAY